MSDEIPVPEAVGLTAPAKKQRRGFAIMTPERQRILASMGGKASHESGRGHQWTSEEAREAGRRGGAASWKNRKKP